MNPGTRHWTAFSLLAVITVTTGASFVLFKALVLVQAPLAMGESTWFISAHSLAPRFLVGTLLLLAIYGGRVLQLSRLEWAQAVFMALTSFAGCLLQNDGLQRSSAATTAFLTQFYVILIPTWMALLHRKLPSLVVWLAGLMVLAGIALLAKVDWHTLRMGRGEAEILLAALFFSLLLCSLNWPTFSANRAERTSAAMFLLEAGLFAGVALVTCRDSVHLVTPYFSPVWIGLAVVSTMLGTTGPFIVMNHWQRHITATEAGLLYGFSPVVAALTEVVLPAPLARWADITYLNQPLTFALVAGGGLILGANVLVQLRPDKAR